MHPIRAILVASIALLVVPSLAGAAPVSSSSQSGTVTATISWDAGVDADTELDTITGIALEIRRGDQVVRSGPLTITGCAEPMCRINAFGSAATAPSVLVRNVDPDTEPEVLVLAFSGGAHCCTTLSVHDWTGTAYRHVQRDFGNGYVTLLGRGASTVMRSIDDRFAYRFTSYAGSWLPVRVLALRRGRYVDVSRSFPGLLQRDAAAAWRTAREQCRSTDEYAVTLGAYAGWAANQYRLGLRRSALATLRAQEAAGCLKGDGTAPTTSFIATLDRFLLQPNPA